PRCEARGAGHAPEESPGPSDDQEAARLRRSHPPAPSAAPHPACRRVERPDRQRLSTNPAPRGPSVSKPLIQTTGRRKESVARVRLRPGTGKITVNGREFDNYFGVLTHRVIAKEPLRLTQT